MLARSLLAEIGVPQLEPTIIYEDNMSTIAMVNNDGNARKLSTLIYDIASPESKLKIT